MKLSIVTTLYRSASHIQEFYERATRAAASLTPEYEIVFVNDGSPDDSLERVLRLFDRDSHVRVVDLSRNFGHHKSMMTGLEHARGDLVFLIDVDLEEDPGWLGDFHAKMAASGADVVYGVQTNREGSAFDRMTAGLFYRMFNAMLDNPIPENILTARLMTRRYVASLVQHRDREVAFAALGVFAGFKQVPIDVRKNARRESTYTVGHRVAVFVNALTSFSSRPLVYIFYLGCAIMLVSGLYGAFLIWRALRGEVGVPGWPSLIVSVWFLGGVTVFCIGVIGIYLSKVFTETKDRPYTIVRALHERTHEPAWPTS
jgi:putative glycosyltransferase